jgi:hypothetical protein
MELPTIEAMAQRLERLERENRRWRRAGIVVALALAALPMIAGASRDDRTTVLEAQRLILKGQDGKVYAELGVLTNKARGTEFPQLSLYDQRGKTRVELAVGPNGFPELRFRDEDQRTRCSLAMLPDGLTQLGFHQKDGWGQLSLGSFRDGAGLMLFGPDGQGRGGRDHGGLFVSSDGSTKLHFFTSGSIKDGAQHERVLLGVGADDTTTLRLRGETLPGGIALEVSPQGPGRLKLSNGVGIPLFAAPAEHGP